MRNPWTIFRAESRSRMCVFHQMHWGLYRGRDWRESMWLGGFFQWSERSSSCGSKIQSRSPSLNKGEAAEIVRACCLVCRWEGAGRHHLGTVQPGRRPGATPSPGPAQPTPRESSLPSFPYSPLALTTSCLRPEDPVAELCICVIFVSFIIQQAFLRLVRC